MNSIEIEMIDTIERWNFIPSQNEMIDQSNGEYVKYSDLVKLCRDKPKRFHPMIQQFLARIDKKIGEHKEFIDSHIANHCIKAFGGLHALQELRSDVEKMEDNTVSKKDALDFAYWYHSGLTNRERRSVEEEFEKYMNETI